MSIELELVREQKLYRLFPERNKKSVLEASGVYATDESTCYVIFDNLNEVGRVDLSLELRDSNCLIPVLNVGTGFEDITYDPQQERFYLIIEALQVTKHDYRGLVSEYESDFSFRSCSQLAPAFERKNKGFEGVGHVRRGDTEYLVGLWEGTQDDQGNQGRGRLYLFPRATDGMWAEPRAVDLPSTAQFSDYAAIARRGNRVAVVSQESKRLWLGEIDESFNGFSAGTGKVYKFPSKSYCNVEGVSWISDDQLVMVSDRRKTKGKKKQDKCCADKDQSIHVFRIPSN